MASPSKTKLLQRVLAGWILVVTLLTAAGVSKWSWDGHPGTGDETSLLELEDDVQDFEPEPDLFLASGPGLAYLDLCGYGEADDPRALKAPESSVQRTTRERSPPAL